MTAECRPELSGDIYDILERASDLELAPVVTALEGTPSSVLAISRAYERQFPNHSMYTDRIGDEIYRLALKTVKAADGRRPSYREMVASTCKQIGIPHRADAQEAGDGLLLDMFLRKDLTLSTADERQELIDEACAAGAAAAKTWLVDEWHPFASAFLQVAYLRRKLVDEGRFPELDDVPPADVLVVEVAASAIGAADIGDAAGAIGATEIGASDRLRTPADWQESDRNGRMVDLFYPAIRAMQPVMAGYQILGGEQLWRVSANGTAHIVAKTHQGMRSLAPVSMTSLLGPAAAVALANAMLEQRRFDQIEARLKEIRAELKDVGRFQQAERRAALTGSIRYFQQVAFGVLTGELASEMSHEIERHEAELLKIQDHLSADIDAQLLALRGARKDVKAIHSIQAALERLHEEISLCLRARACGYQLLSAFPGRTSGLRARLADIRDAAATISPAGHVGRSLDEALREKVQAISSYQSKAIILTEASSFLENARARSVGLMEALDRSRLEGGEDGSCGHIEFRVQEGEVVGFASA